MTLETNPYYNYYTVKDQKFSTRLFALINARSLKNEYPVEWHLPNFEKKFDSLNLLEEPTDTLEYLYLKRAKELRDNYDYLILHYSGGHDSHNILETFMLNNIHLDEILILDQFDRSFRQNLEDRDFEFLHLNSYEPEFSAIPLAKHFIDTYSPHTKLTIVTNSFGIHAKYWYNLSENNMINNLKSSGTLGLLGKTPIRTKDLNLYNPAYRDIKKNKKVAHLWGRDKTCVRFDEKGYFFRFDDGSLVDFIDIYNPLTPDELPQEIEFFYNHPSCANIILKQAHVIMRNVPFHKLNYKIATRKYEDLISTFIYKRKISTTYSAWKLGDFKETSISKYLNKKRDPHRDINLLQIAELSLIKSLDDIIIKNFQTQTKIISNMLKCHLTQVEDILTDNYPTKKFYIKYFE